MSGRPPRLPPEGRAEIEGTAFLRDSLLSDEELASKWHISRTWVKRLMRRARKRLMPQKDTHVPRGTNMELVANSGHIATDPNMPHA